MKVETTFEKRLLMPSSAEFSPCLCEIVSKMNKERLRLARQTSWIGGFGSGFLGTLSDVRQRRPLNRWNEAAVLHGPTGMVFARAGPHHVASFR
jgi:hypothetical protein